MQIINKIKPWLSKKLVRRAISLTIVLIVGVVLISKNNVAAPTVVPQKPVVNLITAAEFAGKQELSLIGTARAFTEAQITSERSGRVTSVNTSLGHVVQAGQVIASLENASERAAVLQAEGVYDAAVASAAQSEVGVDQAETNLTAAKNAAVSAFQSSYNTTNNVVLNSIDDFFSSADTKIPGLRIDGRGKTAELNAERVAFQSILSVWQDKSNTLSADSDLDNELNYAKENVKRTINFLDTFLTIFTQQDSQARYTQAEVDGFIAEFTSVKASLLAQQSSIDGVLAGLSTARESLRRAQLASSGGATSAADAQVKQALGMLRAAQANLAKTILRSPISGTVNSLSIKVGDFINSFSLVAVVANNSALEIVTYVSEAERNLIAIGDTVTIEESYQGTVTQIAPAVDKDTRKIEVRIATESNDIVNGDTVRIVKSTADEDVTPDKIEVPLSAIKFDVENGFVFKVDDSKLVAQPVKLGVVRGNSVTVVEGLTTTDKIVEDARGLSSGTEIVVVE